MSQPPSPAEGTSGAWSRVLPMVWAALLAGLMLGPALGPGLVLSYDMVWVPDLTLRPDFWGLGSSLPRAVPSDVVVSLLDDVLPGAVLQKAVLFGSLAGAGLGIDRLARDWLGARLPARLAAVAAYAWSPYVAERLLLGHWPMLLCYATLPWVLHATNRWREEGQLPAALPLLLVAGSLSASAGVATAIALLATLAGAPVRRLLCGLALAAAANAPWVVAGLLHAGNSWVDPRGAEVFALSGEGPVPAPLAALTLGGVWNREVVPTSRTGLLGWMALGVLALLIVVGAGPSGGGWVDATPRPSRAAGRSGTRSPWRRGCSRRHWPGPGSTCPAPRFFATGRGSWSSARRSSPCSSRPPSPGSPISSTTQRYEGCWPWRSCSARCC